jgi:hypothetical protein
MENGTWEMENNLFMNIKINSYFWFYFTPSGGDSLMA